MTRIDLTTREWHELIRPVLPHVSTDAEMPSICVVRIEGSGGIVYAVATDRYTLAASRHVLGEPCEEFAVHVDKADAVAMLKLFAYSKDVDPALRIIIDKVPVPVAGGHSVRSLGVTIESDEGTRLVLLDRPGGLGGWRKTLAGLVHRDLIPASPRLLLMAGQMSRWTAASRKGERIAVFTGPEPTDPLLILAEDHFAGAWIPASHIDGDSDDLLYDSPWRLELDPHSGEFDRTTGERLSDAVADMARAGGLEVTTDEAGTPTIHIPADDPGALGRLAGMEADHD